MIQKLILSSLCCAALASSPAVQADTGKLVLTGGVSSVDGAAGGGLTPWAVIGSQATEGELGISAHVSRLSTQDYGLTTFGAALGYGDRVELSLAQQRFNAGPALALNGIAPFGVTPGQHIKMDIVGLKLRVAGDAILESDTLMPQIAVGLEHKRTQPGSIGSVLSFLGTRNSGTDLYVSATKLLLAQGLLVNATLRNTNANQNGLLGFGSGACCGPGRRPARRRLERHLHRLGAEQKCVADVGLCPPWPRRPGHHRKPETVGRLSVDAACVLTLH